MNAVVINLILTLASALIDSGTVDRIQAAVERWDDKLDPDGEPYSGDEKFDGVADEVKLIGIVAAQWLINLLIELSVAKLRIAKEGM
ncbi:MAG: hypothetical protein RL661_904 [Pseudomonadota bacterium]|jgi:hypothetical protein